MPSIHNSVWAVSMVTAAVSLACAGLRFIAANRTGRGFGAEDWCALAAAVVVVVYAIISIIAIETVNERPVMLLPLEDLLYIWELTYGVTPLLVFNQTLSKFSLLFFYRRLFGVKKAYLRSIYGLGILQLAWSIASLCIQIFPCQPISKAWNQLTPGTCLDYNATLVGSESINSTIDFVMIALAYLMIRSLRIGVDTKIRLTFVFTLGGLAGIIGFIKIGIVYTSTEPGNFEVGIWTLVQQACSVFCCCAPTYKPLLPNEGFFTRLSTWTWSSGSKERAAAESNSKGNDIPLSSSQAASQRQGWVHLDGSSQRGLAWAEVGTEHQGVDEEEGYPLKTVSIQQKFEQV